MCGGIKGFEFYRWTIFHYNSPVKSLSKWTDNYKKLCWWGVYGFATICYLKYVVFLKQQKNCTYQEKQKFDASKGRKKPEKQKLVSMGPTVAMNRQRFQSGH